MSSLVTTPSIDHAELKAPLDKLEESLFSVWKTPNNSTPNLERLNNRSWRLISERFLQGSQKITDSSFLNPHTNSTDTGSKSHVAQMSSARPSLFSDSSRHTSDRILSSQGRESQSLAQEPISGDESSDISEDDMSGGDYFDYEPLRDQNIPVPQKQQAFLNKKDPRIRSQAAQVNGKASKLPSVDDPSPTQILDAKLSNGNSGGNCPSHNKGNIFYISSSPAPQEKPEIYESLSEKTPPAMSMHLQRKDSLFKSTTAFGESLANSDVSSLSSTDISEVSDIDEQPPSLYEKDVEQVIADARSTKSGRSARSTDDTESEWMSVSSESELGPESPTSQPISFVKRIPIPQPTSDHSNFSPPADETLKSSPSSFKPRSLLSGLFLSELNSSSGRSLMSARSATSDHSASKPVLKRSSTTGVITVDSSSNSRGLQRPSILLSKRYASSSDFSKKIVSNRSPILYVAEEDGTREDSIEENAVESGERNLYAKQTSSVGLSNFLAMANAKNSLPELSSENPHVEQDASQGADVLLSSSLSKYSTLQRENSLKNLFSKSSINLSSLLGHGFSGKLRLHGENKSSENFKSLSQPQHEAAPPMASSFAEHLSQQSLMEPSRSESTITTSKSVRVEPTVVKDFHPSVDISGSLKDSLMIDHKLGKAPLPDRVISDEDLFSGLDKGSFAHESSDYHSKGW